MLMFEISCLTYMNDIKNLLATCTRVLKENKIWFDTFLTFCISFGGLCVGISSCSIANSEKEANLRENDIADKEKQPNFLLESSTFDESDNLVLIVENKGNAYKSISISSLIYVIIPTNNESSFEKKVHRVQTKCSFDFNSHGFTYKDYEINKLKQIQEKKEYGGYIVEFKILYSDYKDENHEITIYSEQSKAFQIGNVPYSDDNKHSMRYVSTMDQFLIDFEEETNN